ncbi:MAG TPA: universal stress protein [Steroidobacteraceae bacterium]|nr:universal stress protein [Steroidobacteraceae bacterium]HQX78223.1 universal stress protein [Steroidobacteraceae bacterium]
MNWKIRRILVAIGDPWQVPPGQLRKAVALAAAAGAHIELFHAIHPARADTVAAARARMTRLAALKVLHGRDVRSCIAIDSPPHEAIVRRAEVIRADLVIAATASHGFGARLLLRNTDWELIRHTPCPVLLVKTGGNYRRAAIVAAIDPFHARAKPAGLDARLLGAATHLAHLLNGAAHAFHAYLPLVAALPGAMGQPVALTLPPEAEEVHSANVRRTFEQLAAHAGIPRGRRHLEMGDVPTRLEAVARRTGAGIVVMGAVSRSALKRLFIGSTAEHLLDRLPCDVLVVKPRQRSGPVR